jgi:hypothetical protein
MLDLPATNPPPAVIAIAISPRPTLIASRAVPVAVRTEVTACRPR